MDKTKKKDIIRKIAAGTMFVAIVAVLLYIRFCVGSVIAVSGLSMYPTFNDGDFVYGTVVDENTELNKNDIVILKEDNQLLIKRIHGVPNETIQNEQLGIERTELKENEYYVVGDNYTNSRDSRSFGPIDRSLIVYKYADIHWTAFTLITTLVLPLVCLFGILTFIMIPGARKERPKYADVVEGQMVESVEPVVTNQPAESATNNTDINA